MSYIIRNEKGDEIARVSNTFASKLMNEVDGEFRPYHVEGKPSKTAFILKKNYVFGLLDFEIYVSKGYKLIPNF